MMRFHRAESAFFVFIAVVFIGALLALHAYDVLHRAAMAPTMPDLAPNVERLARSLLLAVAMMATAIIFGVFFIYPLIRRQVRSERELMAMTQSLSRQSQTFEQAALTDPLTGTNNRRFFDHALREYMDAFGRIDRPLGLLLVDLDHFKRINDTYGHDVGDIVLREVADCLRACTRYHDVLARLGGEEFAVIVPNLPEAALQAFSQRLCRAIGEMPIPAADIRVRVTASIGMALWDKAESAEELYRRADVQLYQAKRAGRNQVA
jgi:two-component system, cell cycle response regulator